MRVILNAHLRAPRRRRACADAAPAFTLIEVLVVVAILALLIAILLPSLAAARDQAQGAVCKTRQRELYSAHLLYSHENKGYFPHYDWWLWDGWPGGETQSYLNPHLYDKYGGTRPTDSAIWLTYGQIYRYVKNRETYFCPKDSKRRTGEATGAGGSWGSTPLTSFSRLFEPHYFALWHKLGHAGWPEDWVIDGTDFLRPEELRPRAWDAETLSYLGATCTTTPDRVGLLYEEWQTADDQLISSDQKEDHWGLNSGHSGPLVFWDFMATRHGVRRMSSFITYWDGHAAAADSRKFNLSVYPYHKRGYAAKMTMGANVP